VNVTQITECLSEERVCTGNIDVTSSGGRFLADAYVFNLPKRLSTGAIFN
jgi:hypothetical protein